MAVVSVSDQAPHLRSTTSNVLPSVIGCALSLKLEVKVCDIHEEIVSISLAHETRRVQFDACKGVMSEFFAISHAPPQLLDVEEDLPSTPFHIKLSLNDKGGKQKLTRDITLGELLQHNGLEVRALTDAKDDGEGYILLKTTSIVLEDPIQELLIATTPILELAKYRMPSKAKLGEPEKFIDCGRSRYVVTPVDQKCTKNDAQGLPIVSHIESPRVMWAWTMGRPTEDSDDDDGEYIDVGDGVLAPKRNVDRLRMAMGTEEEKCRITAGYGKMSMLQASFLKPVEPLLPLTIPLGPPISLCTSPVIKAVHLLESDVQYIEEVDISNSDSEGEVGGDDEDIQMSGSRGKETIEMLFEPEDAEDEKSLKSASSTIDVEDSPAINKMPSMREKIQVMMTKVEAGDEKDEANLQRRCSSASTKLSMTFSAEQAQAEEQYKEPDSGKFGMSESDEDSALDSGSRAPVTGYAPLMKRVDEAERERDVLRRELTYAHAERDRLVEQLRAQSLATKCVSLEAELMVTRRTIEKNEHEKRKLQRKVDEMEKDGYCSSPTGSAISPRSPTSGGTLAPGGFKKVMSGVYEDDKQEYDRLLEVIYNLNEELNRKPDIEGIVEELKEAKLDLCNERSEKEELSRELSNLKMAITQAGKSPTRVMDRMDRRQSNMRF